MWLQLVLFIIAFFALNVYQRNGDTAQARHKYVTLLIILLVLQSALRHLAVGEDTYSYSVEWELHGTQPWSEIWHNIIATYVYGEGKDAGYEILIKLLNYVLPNFRCFLFVYAIVLFVSLFRLVERNLTSLPQIFMSFCLYQVLFYSFFSTTGMRQGMATIVTFWAVKWIQENKLWRFVIAILLASLIHKSVLLFLPFYFIAKIPKSKILLIITLVSMPLLFPFAGEIASFLVDISGAEQYRAYAEHEAETGGAVSFLILIVFISVLALYTKNKKEDSIPNYVINALALAVFFTPMMWVDTSLMRVIQYFSIFSLIGLPLAVEYLPVDKASRSIVYWGLMVVFVITTIRHNYVYGFFWEDMKLPTWYY